MPYYEIPKGKPGPLKTAGGFDPAKSHLENRHTERTMPYSAGDLANQHLNMKGGGRAETSPGKPASEMHREDNDASSAPHLGNDPALEGSLPASEEWRPHDGADENWGVVPEDWRG